MNNINRKPAYTVAELESTRQHQKTGRPSWSARQRVEQPGELRELRAALGLHYICTRDALGVR